MPPSSVKAKTGAEGSSAFGSRLQVKPLQFTSPLLPDATPFPCKQFPKIGGKVGIGVGIGIGVGVGVGQGSALQSTSQLLTAAAAQVPPVGGATQPEGQHRSELSPEQPLAWD